MANLSLTWKRSWKPTKEPTIQPPRYCVWMSNQFSYSRKLDNRFPQPKTIPSALTMSTNGPVQRAFFMFAAPLSGFRQATARPQQTKVDWAVEVAALLDTRYADCDRVTLVCDNLNTHTMGAFHEAFEPERARQYMRRIQFCYTPKTWELAKRCRMQT